MSYNKISVVILGHGDRLKKALITVILGKDLSQVSKRNVLKSTEIYEDNSYVVTGAPDIHTSCEDIRELFAINQHPHMSLMVVEDGFSTEEVWQQIEMLHRITGRPTEEFRVLLPLKSKHPDSYPFKCCTLGEVFNKLSKLTEGRHLMPTDKRYTDHPEPERSTQGTEMEVTGGTNSKGHFTDSEKSFKRNHSGTKVNLVLLGMAGTGKSASGNTILGKPLFKSTTSSSLTTTECQVAETEIGGRHVRVIDTPDIFDDEIKSSVKSKHVRKCKELCQEEPCVYLLVMRASRFIEDERDILKKLEKAFGSRVQEQTVILFTRGEDLWRAKISFENFLHDCQPDLKKIVEKCGRRCVLFENSDSRSPQVEELMKTVSRMFK
ncbi:GTPase IMAP family member 8-like isoform X2 [Epinephelus fuscoguttatus]|uniref:GTPase IMAP family member 8-like isoform X2 n=1 Tax=Epinephelus fuscoguttatus TaxID=293821 RepID=UPI0020D11992|nr:GTPase IMAP family member 8-like isoform X2 [Epinephelus fuscoguttatus]